MRKPLLLVPIFLAIAAFPSTAWAFPNTIVNGERTLGDTYNGVQGDISVNQPAFNQPEETWAANHIAMLVGNAVVEIGHDYLDYNGSYGHYPYFSWCEYDTGKCTSALDETFSLTPANYYWYAIYPNGYGQWRVRVSNPDGSHADSYDEDVHYSGSWPHVDMGGEAGGNNGVLCTDCAIGYWSIGASAHSPQFLEASNNQWYTYCPADGQSGFYDVNINDMSISQIVSACDGSGHWTGNYH